MALADLTPMERETVWEHYWRGLSAPQIAAERGCTVKAVYQLLRRARKKMGERLEA